MDVRKTTFYKVIIISLMPGGDGRDKELGINQLIDDLGQKYTDCCPCVKSTTFTQKNIQH